MLLFIITKEQRHQKKKEFELAQNMFDKASDYWKSAVRLAPNNYIEAQNWLKINGKMAENDGF